MDLTAIIIHVNEFFFVSSHHGTSQDTLMSSETIYILHDLSGFLHVLH